MPRSPVNKNPPIVGWPEWTFTVCCFALVIVQLYLQFSKPLSRERSLDEGQAARQCRSIEETP